MMRVKFWALPIGILLMLLGCLMGFENDTMKIVYPDVSNCFKGFKHNFFHKANAYVRHQEEKPSCLKKGEDNETSVCYKFCMLEYNQFVFVEDAEWGAKDYVTYSVQVATRVGHLLGVTRSNTPEEKFLDGINRLAELAEKCEDLKIHVRREHYVECKYLQPKYQEGIGKLIKCIEDTLVEC